jgi:hypothetical protein
MDKPKKKIFSFEIYAKRLRNLSNYRDLEYSEFLERARKKYFLKYGKKDEEEKPSEPSVNEVGTWVDDSEGQEALNLFNTYKRGYHLESLSDLELLKKLVYCEINAKRIEKILNENSAKVLPRELRAYNELLNQILNIRVNLGLVKNKAEGIFEYIELLKKKADSWKKANPNLSYLPCPYCKNALYIKLKDIHLYQAIKHPLFKDKILWNDELLNLIKERKITFEEGAKVLRTSVDEMKLMFEKKFGIVVSPSDNSAS